MNAEIAVVENETMERGLVTVGRHDIRDEAQRDCLAAAVMGPMTLLSSSHPIMSISLIIASISDAKKQSRTRAWEQREQ